MQLLAFGPDILPAGHFLQAACLLEPLAAFYTGALSEQAQHDVVHEQL
jgi:hypothetical protein